jgi:ABC-type multidrug transport system permease subunit
MTEAPFARHALVQLTLVRLREFVREPEAVFWVLFFPILLAAGLGLAFRSRPPESLRIGLVARPGSPWAAAVTGEPALRVEPLEEAEAARGLRTGRLALLALSDGAGVELRYDDTRPEARQARALALDAVQRAGGRRDPVAVRHTLVREKGSRYIDFVLPGLLGMNLMGSGIWGIGFAIVDARKRRLLKRLVATPMSRAHYLLSFLLHRLLVLVVEVATLVGFGVLVFEVPVRGGLPALAGVCLLSSLAFGALGLLISSRVQTLEGASGLMNFVMLPMWIFSGVFFSSSHFPDALQPAIRALPLTAANDALRATMLEGAGLAAIVPQLAVLAGWLAASFALALRLFRWR